MESALSYWEKNSFFTFDVLIIGSGIVGLNAAIVLKTKQPALSVAIIERGFLPSGASTKNAGFACFGSISELIEQEKSSGTDGLHLLIEKRWKGLLKLRNLLGDTAIDYQDHGGFELFKQGDTDTTQKCVDKIDHFNRLVKDIVSKPTCFSAVPEKINEFGFKDISMLIANSQEGQIDTGRMMKSLIAKATSLGIVIYNSCTVEKIHPEGTHQLVITPHGNFRSQQVLLTTNAFIKDLLPEIDVVPGRGQVMITRPLKNLPVKGTFHYDKGYYYFRNIHKRILIGGGRNLDLKGEETTAFETTGPILNALHQLLQEIILPGIPYETEQVWSGIMAFGSQIHPIVKEIRPGIFCAVRCSGMGVAMGSQTGEDAAVLLLQNK